MSDIKFKFSKEKQRDLNVGKKIDKLEDNKRKIGRHQRNMVVNLSQSELRTITYPSALQVTIYALKDIYGNTIMPSDPLYWTKKPNRISLQVSELNPFPLSRADEYDLDDWITEIFGRYIISENVTEKDEPGIKQNLFRHEGMLQANEDTRLNSVNNNSFNVRAQTVNEQEIDHMNEIYRIIGYKINKNDAIMRTQKTINTPSKLFFEVGEF